MSLREKFIPAVAATALALGGCGTKEKEGCSEDAGAQLIRTGAISSVGGNIHKRLSVLFQQDSQCIEGTPDDPLGLVVEANVVGTRRRQSDNWDPQVSEPPADPLQPGEEFSETYFTQAKEMPITRPNPKKGFVHDFDLRSPNENLVGYRTCLLGSVPTKDDGFGNEVPMEVGDAGYEGAVRSEVIYCTPVVDYISDNQSATVTGQEEQNVQENPTGYVEPAPAPEAQSEYSGAEVPPDEFQQ